MKKIKQLIKENYKYILFYLISFLILIFPLPYYMEAPGGIININDKIEIENGYKSKGTFNMAYVTIKKVNVAVYLIKFIKKDWNLIKKNEIVSNNETEKENDFRDHIYLKEANQNATYVAYKKANKNIETKDLKLYVTYILEDANTNLKIGDQIKKINGIEVNDLSDINKIVQSSNESDTVKIEVTSSNKIVEKEAKIFKYSNQKVIGILVSKDVDYKLENEIKFKFKKAESGPSGGLMMSLAIYDYLTEYDLTKGRKIVGTGTIDKEGNVGEIGSVSRKLMGAYKNKADLFLVPEENYEEAIKTKKEKKYDVKIVKVKTFDEAVEYLKKTN